MSGHNTSDRLVLPSRLYISLTGIQNIRSPCSTIGTNHRGLLVEFRTRLPRAEHQVGSFTMRIVHLEGCKLTSSPRMVQMNSLYQECFIIGLWIRFPCSIIGNRLLTFTSPIHGCAIRRKSHFSHTCALLIPVWLSPP